MDAYYQQWGMEDDGDPVVSGWWTAALFEKASFGCLAWKGDELFGAAVGHARSMKKLELGSSWKSSVVWAQEAVDKLGGEAMALLDEISICNRRLAQRAQADGRRFAAELDFLWVSPKARGMGLSKRLLTEVHAVMRAHGAQEYALFTDNYCDYSFYQRKPWEKIGEMIWPSPKWAGSSRSFMFARRSPDGRRSLLFSFLREYVRPTAPNLTQSGRPDAFKSLKSHSRACRWKPDSATKTAAFSAPSDS